MLLSSESILTCRPLVHRTVSFNTGLLVLEGVAWFSESIPPKPSALSSEELHDLLIEDHYVARQQSQ